MSGKEATPAAASRASTRTGKPRSTTPKPSTPRRPDRKEAEAAEEAKLLALLDDPTPGAHAAVIREVTGLRLDNKRLKRQNLRIWSAFGGVVLVAGISIGAFFVWFPKYRYVATTDNKAVCDVATQADAPVRPATLEDFAKEAAINSYTYDYVNYRSIINDATNTYFNERGRKAFLKSLDDSGNLERVVKGRLIMKTFATNSPQLENEGREGKARYWIVHVPMAIEFYVGGNQTPSNTQDFRAEVKVMQEQASAVNPKGLAVDSIVLKPITRGK